MAQYVNGVIEDSLANVQSAIPDNIGPFKTANLIGYTAVISTGLLTFAIVKRTRRRKKRKRKR